MGPYHHHENQSIPVYTGESSPASSKGATTQSSSVKPSLNQTDQEHVIVGIPAYNEEIGIGSVVLAVWEYADEVLVIDDGSTDRTAQIARNAGARVIEHAENRGKGHALRTLLETVRDTEFDALVLLDADGQHVATDIPTVQEPVLDGDCDIAIGSRYTGGIASTTPFHRRVGQRILDFLTTSTTGQSVTDSQSGFRALSADAVQAMRIQTDGYGVESEMIRNATEADLQIEEVPIEVRYRDIDGQTMNPVRHGLSVVSVLVQLFRDCHPLLFFSVLRLVLLLVGTLIGIVISSIVGESE